MIDRDFELRLEHGVLFYDTALRLSRCFEVLRVTFGKNLRPAFEAFASLIDTGLRSIWRTSKRKSSKKQRRRAKGRLRH